MGLVPPVESILISDQSMPVAICTEATCGIAILSSLLPNSRDLTRLTRWEVTTIRVGNMRLPLVQRLAEKDSVEGPAVDSSVALISVFPSLPQKSESRQSENLQTYVGGTQMPGPPGISRLTIVSPSLSAIKDNRAASITVRTAFVYNRAFHLSSHPLRRTHCPSTKQSTRCG